MDCAVSTYRIRAGGYIITNYDKSKSLSDSSSIKLPITSFIDNEMLVLKVILNSKFAKSVRDSDANLQEIIQFIKIDDDHTKIVSSMIGWGTGADWDNTYDFFVKGNEWTYHELLKNYK
jgi:archaellum biogenesis ATPase FlaH